MSSDVIARVEEMLDEWSDIDDAASTSGLTNDLTFADLRALIALARKRAVKRPDGDAGDALDYALGHLPETMRTEFLEDWRGSSNGSMLDRWPKYGKWVETQRRGAALAQASPEPIVKGEDDANAS